MDGWLLWLVLGLIAWLSLALPLGALIGRLIQIGSARDTSELPLARPRGVGRGGARS